MLLVSMPCHAGDNPSPQLDCSVLALTVSTVLQRLASGTTKHEGAGILHDEPGRK